MTRLIKLKDIKFVEYKELVVYKVVYKEYKAQYNNNNKISHLLEWTKIFTLHNYNH